MLNPNLYIMPKVMYFSAFQEHMDVNVTTLTVNNILVTHHVDDAAVLLIVVFTCSRNRIL